MAIFQRQPQVPHEQQTAPLIGAGGMPPAGTAAAAAIGEYKVAKAGGAAVISVNILGGLPFAQFAKGGPFRVLHPSLV